MRPKITDFFFFFTFKSKFFYQLWSRINIPDQLWKNYCVSVGGGGRYPHPPSLWGSPVEEVRDCAISCVGGLSLSVSTVYNGLIIYFSNLV